MYVPSKANKHSVVKQGCDISGQDSGIFFLGTILSQYLRMRIPQIRIKKEDDIKENNKRIILKS